MATRRCNGRTKKGAPCKAAPLHDSQCCLAHSDADTRASVGFTPEAGHAGGRPRLPRPHEVLREKIEGEIETWIAPYEEALEATKAVVVGSGESAEVEMVPDFKLRLEAADAALNRVYGRPKQLLEHTGKDEGPVQHALDIADPKVRGHLDKALEASAKAERAPR